MRKNLLVAAMLAQPWALMPDYMHAMAGVIARWQAGIPASAEVMERIRADQQERQARRDQAQARAGGSSIAVIPVYGVITQRGNMADDVSGPGSVSTEQLVAALRAAEADNTVFQILLDFNSPGGSVYGIIEAAAEINRIKAIKPITGLANSLCASAAYWLMSQCSQCFVTPGGEVGSIGVWQAHEDMSKALEEAGVRITLVSAGKFKTEGNSFNPLDDEAKAFMQLRTDEYYAPFTKAVAKGRGVPIDAVRNGMGQGRVLGADASLAEKMVDGIATFDEVLKKVQRSAAGPPGPRRLPFGGHAARGRHPFSLSSVVRTRATFVFQPHPLRRVFSFLELIYMSKKLRELQARKQTQVTAMRAFLEKASAEERDPSEEELVEFETQKARIAATERAIERERELIALEASLPVVSHVSVSETAHITVAADNQAADPKAGFKTFGEFAAAVRIAGLPGNHGRIDPRLGGRYDRSAAAPSTFGNEAAGADGGFAVPPVYAREIFTLSQTEGTLLPDTDNIEIESNAMAFPKDETTPWGTDGVRAYWQGEAVAGTPGKPKLGLAELRMKKLLSLVPVTDELLEDATALNSYLPGKMADSIRWKLNESILFGTGAGQPQGAFASDAVVTVAKETGQAASTLNITNIAKMIARLPEGSYARARWMLNNDVLPALFTLTLGNYPIYIPASEGAKGNPYGTLMGRPIMVTQHAKSFSSQGDVMLGDLKYYRTITKADGIELATSLHLYFDADAVAFRATFRVDGQSKLSGAIPPANGNAKLSPFVQLGAR